MIKIDEELLNLLAEQYLEEPRSICFYVWLPHALQKMFPKQVA